MHSRTSTEGSIASINDSNESKASNQSNDQHSKNINGILHERSNNDSTFGSPMSSASMSSNTSLSLGQISLGNEDVKKTNSNIHAENNTVQSHLTIRFERPIENCEINPFVSFYQTHSVVDSNGHKKQRERNAIPQEAKEYKFRWLRGPVKETCAYSGCPRANGFRPKEWSRYAKGGVLYNFECDPCVRLKVAKKWRLFCTVNCLSEAWKQHQRIHYEVKILTEQHKHLLKISDGLNDSDNGNTNKALIVMNNIQQIEDKLRPYLQPPRDGVNNEAFGINSNNNTNSKSSSDVDNMWVEVSTDRSYVPVAEDVGHTMRIECTVYNNKTGQMLFGPKIKVTEPVLSAPVPAPSRPWMHIREPFPQNAIRMRCSSYNMLAEIYATPSIYPYCDSWSLQWQYRKDILFQELKQSQSDVFCLQEVQKDYYQMHVQPFLNSLDYEGVYKAKTRESMGEDGKVDGCAIFWRKGMYGLVDSYEIEYNVEAQNFVQDLYSREKSSVALRLMKGNIGMAVILEVLNSRSRMTGSGTLICVANTHLYSHPEFPDVKLFQCYSFLSWLMEKTGMGSTSTIPTIIMGDFNSPKTSAVYHLIANGRVNNFHDELTSLESGTGKQVINTLFQNQSVLNSPFNHLKSAYYDILNEEPPYTNYTVGYKGVLDYIWYTEDSLKPYAVLSIPDEAQLTRSGEALPNPEYASDHLILSCEFCLLQDSISPALQSIGLGQQNLPLGIGLQQTQQQQQNAGHITNLMNNFGGANFG